MARTDEAEAARLAALTEYGIAAALSEPGYSRLVQLAANVLNVPVVLISLVEAERQLFLARLGVDVCETSLDISFCTHTIRNREVMVVPDATLDPRFANNPLVTGPPHIRFYAGAPLLAPSGHAVGSFCVIDTKPRELFDQADRRNLRDLAALTLDKMEARRLELARRASQLRFETIAGNSPDTIICADGQGVVTFWNPAAERLLGYTAAEMRGASIGLIAPREIKQRLNGLAASAQPSREESTVEIDVIKKNGAQIPVELSISMWRDGGAASFGVILRDISERRANEERLFRLAHLDPLTELPNRVLLRNRIEHSLAHAAATLVLLDLDGFKDVNDSLGHAAGDAVLVCVAEGLRRCVRPSDTVARIGGDEFAILLPGVADPERAGRLTDAAIDAIVEIRSADGQPINIGASAGIAIFPSHGSNAEELLSSADLALYQAKAEGRQCRRFFTPVLRQAAVLKRSVQGELRRAREQAEFELFYQPQVRLADDALVGAEALMRWRHPQRGLLAPAAFMPALMNGPLAAPLGEWAIRTACAQAAAWRAGGAANFQVAVNLFGAQFRTGNLADRVRAALAEAALPPSALELELPRTSCCGTTMRYSAR